MKLTHIYDRLAEFYDDDMGRNIGNSDIPVYLDYCRQQQPVLELGCGTGRIMEALVSEGIEVMGIDNSQAMLDQATGKLKPYRETLWSLKKGDLARFEAPCGFGVAICAFSTYSKLLSKKEQQGFFTSVQEALVPGGQLVMEMFIQGKAFDALPVGEKLVDYEDRPVKGGTLTRMKTIYRDVEPQVNKIVLDYAFVDDKGNESKLEVEDFTRYSHPDELVNMAEECGLTVNNLFGGYDRTPYAEGDTMIILEAERR